MRMSSLPRVLALAAVLAAVLSCTAAAQPQPSATPPPAVVPSVPSEKEIALACASVRAMLEEYEKEENDQAKQAELSAKADKRLRPIVSDPRVEALEPWWLAGLIAWQRKDAELAAFAFEAIERIKPDYASHKGLLATMGRLDAMGVSERAPAIRNDRESMIANFADAMKGNANAMNNLGVSFATGQGVLKSEQKAVEWFTKAANAGSPHAMVNLGSRYDIGTIGPVDSARAAQLYLQAAELGYANGMWKLAQKLMSGEGVAKDEAKAEEWFRKAAAAGHEGALARFRTPGELWKVEPAPGVVIETAWVPAGVFTMGSPETEANHEADEGPQHRVRIGGGPRADKGFWMMTTEVQQGQWQAVMGSNPSSFKSGPTYPVERVSWYDAVEFANKLTEAVAAKNPGMNLKEYYTIDVRKRGDDGRIEEAEVRINPGNRGYRLPTEAEWEYACRAGTTSSFHFGQTISTDVANYDGNSIYATGMKGEDRQRTTPTAFFGERGKNAWGLHDMHGNVWEWCWDWYDSEWYKPARMAGERVNPTGPQAGGDRVLRGGSWYGFPRGLRSAYRDWYWPSYRGSVVGFRLLLDSE